MKAGPMHGTCFCATRRQRLGGVKKALPAWRKRDQFPVLWFSEMVVQTLFTTVGTCTRTRSHSDSPERVAVNPFCD